MTAIFDCKILKFKWKPDIKNCNINLYLFSCACVNKCSNEFEYKIAHINIGTCTIEKRNPLISESYKNLTK